MHGGFPLLGGNMLDNIKSYYDQRLAGKVRTFRKSFLITFITTCVICLAGVIAWNRLTAPPLQAELIAAPPPDETRFDEEGYYIPALAHLEEDVEEDEPDDEDVDESQPSPNAPHWAEDRRAYFWTFLIIGLNNGTNANTIMVASYCGITREANLISIPRDIPVNATRNNRKLSASYMIGAGGGRGIAGGVYRMQNDVMTVIGFVPDFYVVLDYDAFFSIIDAVGGIEIYVPIRMRYDDPLDNLRIDIQPGLQHMDSTTALHFARFRQGNPGFPNLPRGDIDRVANQQEVINAVIRRLLRPENLNPLRINEFVNIFNDSVYTNISFSDMVYFANELNHIRRTDTMTDALSTFTFAATPFSVWRGETRTDYVSLTLSDVLEILNSTINPFDRDISAEDLRIIRQ